MGGGRPKAYWLTGFFNPQGFLTAVQQEVTRRHQGWALDGVQLNTEVTSFEKEDTEKKDALEEGVYIWGLFLEAAAWDKKEAARYLHNQYMCPCYTIPRRTGLNFVFVANIKTEDPAQKWVLRGTALMCASA